MLALADVAVMVTSAKASAEWWEKNLGFSTYTIGGGHAVLVAPPGERFVLHLCEGFGPLEPGNTGIAFVTDEIEKLVARMTKARIRFPEPLRKESWGGMAKFADADGNIFWLLGAPRAFVRSTLTSRAPDKKRTDAKSRERAPKSRT